MWEDTSNIISPPSSPSLLTSTPQPPVRYPQWQRPIPSIDGVNSTLLTSSLSPPMDKKARRHLSFACKKEFECVVCYSVPHPITIRRLKTCHHEHIICLHCTKALKDKVCPLCKEPLNSFIKNIHVQSLLLDTQKVSFFDCVQEKCDVKQMSFEESIAHAKVCPHKFFKCPRRDCKKTFSWTNSGPQYFCRDHVILTKCVSKDEWEFAVYLTKLYSQDTNRVRQNKHFKCVFLLNPIDGKEGGIGGGFRSDIVDRLALQTFYYLNDLFFSIVCLEDSTLVQDHDIEIVHKTNFFLTCSINVGYGVFMKSRYIPLIFQNEKVRKSKCLRVTAEYFCKFANMTHVSTCIECPNVDQHIHFRIQKV